MCQAETDEAFLVLWPVPVLQEAEVHRSLRPRAASGGVGVIDLGAMIDGLGNDRAGFHMAMQGLSTLLGLGEKRGGGVGEARPQRQAGAEVGYE